jgi:hypothetical protein
VVIEFSVVCSNVQIGSYEMREAMEQPRKRIYPIEVARLSARHCALSHYIKREMDFQNPDFGRFALSLTRVIRTCILVGMSRAPRQLLTFAGWLTQTGWYVSRT